MKRIEKSKLLAILVVLIVLVLLLALPRITRQPTITRYEDADGNVFECSRPIKAKMGAAKEFLGHPQGLIPYNQADADKYCHFVGVE